MVVGLIQLNNDAERMGDTHSNARDACEATAERDGGKLGQRAQVRTRFSFTQGKLASRFRIESLRELTQPLQLGSDTKPVTDPQNRQDTDCEHQMQDRCLR